MQRADSAGFLSGAFCDDDDDHHDGEFLLIDKDDDDQVEYSKTSAEPQHRKPESNFLRDQDDEDAEPAVMIQMEPVRFNDDDNEEQVPRRKKSAIKKSSSYTYLMGDIPICMKDTSYRTLPKPDINIVRSQSMASFFPPPQDEPSKPIKRNVSFSNISMRNYPLVLGDNPSVSYGPPTTLAWDFEETHEIELEAYEKHRPPRRKPREMLLNYYQRKEILTNSGHSEQEIKDAKRQAEKAKRQRNATKSLMPLMKLEDAAHSAARKAKRAVSRSGSSGTLSACSSSGSLTAACG